MALSSAYLQVSQSRIFYFRIAVPQELRQTLKRREIHRSLKTRCRVEAVLRGARLLEQVHELFRRAQRGLSVCLMGLSWDRPSATEAKHNHVHKPVSPVKVQKGPKLSEVSSLYLKEQRREGVSEKTLADKLSVVHLLVRIVGDLPMRQIGREQARLFKDTALKLPPRMGQLPPKPLEKLIAEADSTISNTTFNNYVKNLVTLFGFAVREGYCDLNPFQGLRIQQRQKANEQRSRFSEEELQRILSSTSTVFDHKKPHRYWLPLLGLYTGARMNELCQLYVDDVVQMDGIDCLHIRSTRIDQKLKNASSERLIPIHSRLKELGFLTFIESQRSLGHARVFAELSLHKRHGYSHIPSRWFAGVREKLGLKGGAEKKDFHSFRHTVADHLKQQGIAESLIGGLLGHTTGGVTFTRYGKDYKPEVIAPIVEKLLFN